MDTDQEPRGHWFGLNEWPDCIVILILVVEDLPANKGANEISSEGWRDFDCFGVDGGSLAAAFYFSSV